MRDQKVSVTTIHQGEKELQDDKIRCKFSILKLWGHGNMPNLDRSK